MRGADVGNGLQRVQHPGAGLAVDQHDVADARVLAQPRIERGGRHGFIIAETQHRAAPPHHLRKLGGALAVGAVVQHQHMAVARHHGSHGGLDAEGATALQGHDDMGVVALHDVQQ